MKRNIYIKKKVEFVEDNLKPVNNQYHMMISKDTYQNIYCNMLNTWSNLPSLFAVSFGIIGFLNGLVDISLAVYI